MEFEIMPESSTDDEILEKITESGPVILAIPASHYGKTIYLVVSRKE